MTRRIAAYDAFSVSRGVMDNEVIGQAEDDDKMENAYLRYSRRSLERAPRALNRKPSLEHIALAAGTGTTAAGHSSVQRASLADPVGYAEAVRICAIIASSWRGASRRDSRA